VRPIVAGKPEPPLHAESVERVGARHPLVVGDRLDTDIEGAVRGHTDSLLVLTGVTTPADLLLAAPRRRPAYVAADLGGLNVSHPAVIAGDGGFHCGGWTVAVSHGGWLAASGDGDWVDGLRALCAAAWTAGPPPGGAAAQAAAAESAVAAIKPDQH
jgi:hypothetical protein